LGAEAFFIGDMHTPKRMKHADFIIKTVCFDYNGTSLHGAPVLRFQSIASIVLRAFFRLWQPFA
jgi:hypothetical protein